MEKYIPKKKEKFRAFLKVGQPGKEHFRSPFTCNESGKLTVDATDRGGCEHVLKHHDFYFKPMA